MTQRVGSNPTLCRHEVIKQTSHFTTMNEKKLASIKCANCKYEWYISVITSRHVVVPCYCPSCSYQNTERSLNSTKLNHEHVLSINEVAKFGRLWFFFVGIMIGAILGMLIVTNKCINVLKRF